MSRRRDLIWIVLTISVLGWIASCSDGAGPDTEPAPLIQGLLISNPIALLTPTAAAPTTMPSEAAADGLDDVTFVSLVSHSVEGGVSASIRNLATGAQVWTSIADGGFDPVPIPASVDDTLAIQVFDAQQSVILEERIAVRRARPPVVTRTNPPRRKRDVALNTSIMIAFSEPVDPATLTSSSVRVVGGFPRLPVPGRITMLGGSGTLAAFTPSRRLVPNTEYELLIGDAVQDLDGSALLSGASVVFQTGRSTVGPPAIVRISQDTVYLVGIGATYQISAIVEDSAGNVLLDQPVWSVSDENGLSVTPTGLVTVLAPGRFAVMGTVNGMVFSATIVATETPASIEIAPSPVTVAEGDTAILTATVRNAAGDVLFDYPPLRWGSTAAGTATVNTPYGSPVVVVSGVSPGTATVTAVSGPAVGSVPITVTPPQPVGSVMVAPGTATIVKQATIQLSAALRDINDRPVTRPISWSSDNPAVASVDPSGLVTGVAAGSAGLIATSEGVSGTAHITITTLSFVAVAVGQRHTCGLTSDSLAYCWGEILAVEGSREVVTFQPTPVLAAGGLRFTSISAGEFRTCALTGSGDAYCWGADVGGRPIRIQGWTFASLIVGSTHRCGLTAAGAAFCWGFNAAGALGDGTTIDRSTPTPVSGGITFTQLAVGKSYFTCGLAVDSTAYCWGRNEQQQLGVGPVPEWHVPAPVSGPKFVSLSTGYYHSCGLAATGQAYCWGNNSLGQVGDGTWSIPRSAPVAVTGEHVFIALSAKASQHTCGRKSDGSVYCWGLNSSGHLGVPPTEGCTSLNQPCSTSPIAVTGGLRFQDVQAGGWHTCGLSDGTLYCWGENIRGELGDGSLVNRYTPVRVVGQ